MSRWRGQFKFDKKVDWTESVNGLLTGAGMTQPMGFLKVVLGISLKINNCRDDMTRWHMNNPLYDKEKISELQQALKQVQTYISRTHEEIMEVSRKHEEAYKDKKEY